MSFLTSENVKKEALSVPEQLLQCCKDRDCRDPLQQENYNLWCNKSQQRHST